MSYSKRAVFLGLVTAVVTSLWGCQAAGPMKVPLAITAIPDNTLYVPSSLIATGPPGRFHLDEQNPTTTLTLGGIEYIVRADTAETAEMPTTMPDGSSVSGRLLLKAKNSTQELTVDLMSPDKIANTKPTELTLENGRKYLLRGWGSSYVATDDKTRKQSVHASGFFWTAGVQTGKIGSPTPTPIAIFDSNMDGFYTSDQDGIIVGSPTAFTVGPEPQKFNLVQPFSKYISTSNGIFELQNLAKDGSELTAIPYRGPTASLQVIVPQKLAGQIVLTSSDANLNVTVSDKGESTTVIPGNYTILIAVLGSPPQDSQPQGSVMLISGKEMPALKLEAGAKQVLTLSGPKVLEFQAAMVGDKVNIKPDMFHIKGQAGEIYSQVNYDRGKPPKVYLNVDGKSILLGKMAFG
ncbi:MAG: hypothetical protein FWD61_17880 [Phycisphaerales bacterium]|nr:hypothetical protein [Phycisphaerales bacterium]